jgi:(R,R)-butanediol dehydrogenase/meso-butanediol dehydrogenase/diacetyl reductase
MPTVGNGSTHFRALGALAYVRDHHAVIRMVQEGKVDLKSFITSRTRWMTCVVINHKDTAVKVLVHP